MDYLSYGPGGSTTDRFFDASEKGIAAIVFVHMISSSKELKINSLFDSSNKSCEQFNSKIILAWISKNPKTHDGCIQDKAQIN